MKQVSHHLNPEWNVNCLMVKCDKGFSISQVSFEISFDREPFDVPINDYVARLFMKGVNLSLGHSTKRQPFLSLMNICVNNDNLIPTFTMCYYSNFSQQIQLPLYYFLFYFHHLPLCPHPCVSKLSLCVYIM